jgi:hypothetical protein
MFRWWCLVVAVCLFKLNKMAQFIENVTHIYILRDKVASGWLEGKETNFFFKRVCLEKISFVSLFHI